MTRDDLAEMLADRTPACGPARDALFSGGTFDVADNLIPANWHLNTYARRLRTTQRGGVETVGLTETVGILRQAGDEPLRIGLIRTADHACVFVLFLNAAATTVLACARGGRAQLKGD